MSRLRFLPVFFILCLVAILVASCSLKPPTLTDGTNSWPLKTVTFPASVPSGTGDVIFPKDDTYILLRAEFDCTNGVNLTAPYLGETTSSISNFNVYQPGGFADIYISNNAGEKYPVVLLEDCAVTGTVPKDGTNFSLNFKELDPVSLRP